MPETPFEHFGTLLYAYIKVQSERVSWLSQRTDISEGTIRTWIQPKVPRHKEIIPIIAAVLSLNKVETNRLLQAARYPTLDRIPQHEVVTYIDQAFPTKKDDLRNVVNQWYEQIEYLGVIDRLREASLDDSGAFVSIDEDAGSKQDGYTAVSHDDGASDPLASIPTTPRHAAGAAFLRSRYGVFWIVATLGVGILVGMWSVSRRSLSMVPESTSQTRVQSSIDRATFILDVGINDDERLTPGETFTKGWRFYNGGSTDWKQYELLRVSSEGSQLGPDGVVVPNDQPVVPQKTDYIVYLKDVAAPTTPGCYRVVYRLVTPDGQPFGDKVWYQIAVVPKDEAAIDYVLFINHLNIFQGTLMTPGYTFRKEWRLHNCGDNAWVNYKAVRIQGEFGPSTIAVPPISPGQDLILSTQMQAPLAPGTYTSVYQLVNAQGFKIGAEFNVNINVKP